MSFAMQSFLNARSELDAETSIPSEVAEALSKCGFPPVTSAVKQGRPAHGETFVLTFKSAVPAKLAPTAPGSDRTQAVLHVLGPELGLCPFFSAEAPASEELVRRALAAAGTAAPKLWLSGELVRRGALRQLPWVLLERLPTSTTAPAATAAPASAVGSSLDATESCREWLPRYDDAFMLLAELRRLAISAGATELDGSLARLSLACRDDFKLEPKPPRFFLFRAAHALSAVKADPKPASTKPASKAAVKSEEPLELEESGGGGGAPVESDGEAGFGSMAPWGAACAGDARIVEATGEPWDLLRAFSDVVKARWLMDLLRRTPGAAPRCELAEILKAHDHGQAILAERGWLPAAIVAPGSSSARLAETAPEELCPHY